MCNRTRILVRGSLALFLAIALRAEPGARAKEFIDSLAKGNFTGAAAMLDADLGPKLPAPALEQIWQGLHKQFGAFRKSDVARIEASPKLDVVFVSCEFEKMTLDARIPVNKTGQVGGLTFSQHSDYYPAAYIDPSSFEEKDVMVGAGDWALHGSLTIPKKGGPFPGVVLVHGSGAADRDATIGANKPFRDIAWGLASRGIAVLRYNKRANEHPEEFDKLASFTVKEETIDDAIAAVAILRNTPSIDPKKLFVLGHSLGGTLIPRIGKSDPQIAGLIVVGGTTHSMLDLLLPQIIQNYSQARPKKEAQRTRIEEALNRLKQQVARAQDPDLKPDTPRSELPFGIPAAYWLDLRGYHPEQAARELKQPMLILQGERDYQVTMEDFATWKKALADRKNVACKAYPGLNHVFMKGEGPSSDEEYTRPGHVASTVIEDIAAWIKPAR